MKKILLYTAFYSILIFFFSGCSSCNKKQKNSLEQQTEIKSTYGNLPTEQQNIIDIIYKWNAFHDSINIDNIEQFYNDNVQFFTKNTSIKSIIETKKYKIKHADSYRQRIIGRIGIFPSDTGDYKCEFLKLVTINEKPNVFHSYLIFKKMQDSTWRIIVESDKEADVPRPVVCSLFDKFSESESISSGDFNGDGVREELVVIKPEKDTSGNYITTETKISFTNIDLPEIVLSNCIGVNVLNENDVDGDGAEDFSIVIKTPSGNVGDVVLYSFKRGAWQKLANFKAPSNEVFGSRQNLIEFAGSGNIKIRTIEKTVEEKDSLVIKTISTWGE